MMHIRPLLLVLLTLSSAVRAEDGPESIRLYQVELLMFQHLDGVARDAWPATRLTRVPRNARALLPFQDENGEWLEPPPGFHRVGREDVRLGRAFDRLGHGADVRPRLHLAWRQSHDLLRAGRRVRLDGEADDLTGFVALRLGTRLVAELDLSLTEPAHGIYDAQADAPWTPGVVEREEDGLAPPQLLPDPPPPRGFRLHQRRTIRLGENHYFDHPAFGVILRVERIDPEA